MPIARLTISEWQDNQVKEQVIDHPTLEQVETAVRRLDNRSRNDLYLQPVAEDSETYLAVGGGDGRYVLTGAVSGERFPSLIDPSRPSRPLELLRVGGQDGDYPANAVHDLETTLRAVRAFYATGRFEGEQLPWLEP
jgi:hypothetical protein